MASPAVPSSVARNSPYLALGLTFLLLGFGFSASWQLVPNPPSGMWNGLIAPEALNLYALVSFLGWAHFAFAWRGQFRATLRLTPRPRVLYWSMILLLLAVLLVTRAELGVAVFSLLVWTYNIGHLIKTEVFFAEVKGRISSPTIAFAFFTAVLFLPTAPLHPLTVLTTTLVLAGCLLATGDWNTLQAGIYRLPLLSLFFLGETLIWNVYGRYMSPSFRVGVYIMHIAAASFFHYLSSYLFARSAQKDPLSWTRILLVNLLVISLGCASVRLSGLRWLAFLLDPVWFTVWVALHLGASDLLPWWKHNSFRLVRGQAALGELT